MKTVLSEKLLLYHQDRDGEYIRKWLSELSDYHEFRRRADRYMY